MFSRRKILIVEDNQVNRCLLCEILGTEYVILEAGNGEDALQILEQQAEGISLILLDIVMPIMDGYSFLSAMKQNPSYSSIPVIVTTQNDGEDDEVAALSHGATDFVAKPYKAQVILHRVASIINLRETAAMINLIKFDRLTGLYSKEYFHQQIREILKRNPNCEYDIICSDIENFKLINDILGVNIGDNLLCGIADIYREKLGNRGICGRLNADQFACFLLRGVTYDNELFEDLAEKINNLMEVKNIFIKWGIYYIEDNSLSVEMMCDRAILAACSIKGQYGKYFALYDDKLRNQMVKNQTITDSMEEALATKQFQVYLQPKYTIENQSLDSVEALVRWIHPRLGFQSPADFIPLFEQNGFITKLDQYMWEEVCSMMHSWDQKGYKPLAVSVNVSRADIYNADIVDYLYDLVTKYNLSPSRLHLEITESAYTENSIQIIDTVNRLKKLGFIIEMDDFGSGYSSLNMLNEMPIDILKLDMKFVQSEDLKLGEKSILHFIINLARWLGLEVVAEGVETVEQLNKLSELGCDYAQGYYFSKPIPYKEFEEQLEKENK